MKTPKQKDAKAFAKNAQIGVTYYYVVENRHRAAIDRRWVGEVTFDRVDRLFSQYPMKGNVTADQYWMDYGPLYDDRNHPAIRSLLTSLEIRAADDEAERGLLGGEHWAKEMRNATNDTRFWTRKH